MLHIHLVYRYIFVNMLRFPYDYSSGLISSEIPKKRLSAALPGASSSIPLFFILVSIRFHGDMDIQVYVAVCASLIVILVVSRSRLL